MTEQQLVWYTVVYCKISGTPVSEVLCYDEDTAQRVKDEIDLTLDTHAYYTSIEEDYEDMEDE